MPGKSQIIGSDIPTLLNLCGASLGRGNKSLKLTVLPGNQVTGYHIPSPSTLLLLHHVIQPYGDKVG